MKIEVSNPGGLDPTPLSWEFDVTIVDFCRDSQLSFDASQADESYVIDAVAPTADQAVAFVSISTSTDATRCPITVALEIYDGVIWNGNTGDYSWINTYSSTGFNIQTDDADTYANPSNS